MLEDPFAQPAAAPPPEGKRPAAPGRDPGLGDRVRSLRLPPPAPPRKSLGALKGLLFVLVGVVLGAGLVLVFWGDRLATGEKNGEPGTTKPAADSPKEQAGSLAAAESASPIALESKGYIIPTQQILVSPKVSGMVIKLDLEEGRTVPKGHILAEIEKTDYQAELDRAKAGLSSAAALRDRARSRVEEATKGFRPEEKQQAEAEVAEAKAQLGQLESEFARTAQLLKKGAVTQQDYEGAESKMLAMQQKVKRLSAAAALMNEGERSERRAMASHDLEQTEAAVRLAQAELDKAQWRFDNCTIRAPISGTILKKRAEEGNIVNPIAFNGSYSLCDMADLSRLEVELNIQERDISQVFPGQKCVIRADAWPDRRYTGVVSRLMPIADRAKGSVPVRVQIDIPADEAGGYLKPEMAAAVTFYKKEKSNDGQKK